MRPSALDPSAGDASTDSLIEVIGEAAARAFCEAFGGVGLYVPERVGEHHPIAVAIGVEAAQRLAAAYHGMELQVPIMGRRRAQILELYNTGRFTNREIARRVGVTERRVYQVLAEDGSASPSPQSDLFHRK